jgi:serine/threonine-protein kinase
MGQAENVMAVAQKQTIAGRDNESSDKPKIFGRYVLLRKLGQGGVGQVYEAYDPTLARKIAIKVIRPALADEDAAWSIQKASLIQEARALAKVTHPNVVQIYDVGQDDEGGVYLAMEFIDGSNLRHAFEDKQTPWRTKISWLVQAAAGIEAAHRAGIHHRDLKPENLLLGKDGRVCVCDFGLASSHQQAREAFIGSHSPFDHSGDLAPSALSGGTPRYMAPEQIRGEATDHRTDVFAFACMVFEARCAVAPFPSDDFVRRIEAIEQGRWQGSPLRPRWLHEAVRERLHADPQKRSADIGAFAAQLMQGLARERTLRNSLAISAFVLTCSALWMIMPTEKPAIIDPDCRDPSVALVEDWNESIATTLRQTFADKQGQVGVQLWERVRVQVQSWHDDWVANAKELCPTLPQRRSPELKSALWREKSRVCLAQRRAEMRELLAFWLHGSAKALMDAMSAMQGLSRVDSCTDINYLQALLPMPTAPEERAWVTEGLETISRARVAASQADFARALALVQQLESEVASRPSWILSSNLAYARGDLEYRRAGFGEDAEAWLERAQLIAHLNDDVEHEAAALFNLWFARVYRGSRLTLSQELLRTEQSVVMRGQAPLRLRALLARTYGLDASVHGRSDRALDFFRQSLAMTLEQEGELSLASAMEYSSIAYAATLQEDRRSALDAFERALTIVTHLLPPGHPTRSRAFFKVALAWAETDDWDQAVAYAGRGWLECWQNDMPAESCDDVQDVLAIAATTRGDYQQAWAIELGLHEIEAQTGQRIASSGPWTELALAHLAVRRGELDLATMLAQQGLEKMQHARHVHAGASMSTLIESATVFARAGQQKQAEALLSQVAERLHNNEEYTQRLRPRYLHARGLLALGRGNANDAASWLEEALASESSNREPGLSFLDQRLEYAQALVQSDALDVAEKVAADAEFDFASSSYLYHLRLEWYELASTIAWRRGDCAQADWALMQAQGALDPVSTSQTRYETLDAMFDEHDRRCFRVARSRGG